MSTYFDDAFLGSPGLLDEDEIVDLEGAGNGVSSNNHDTLSSRRGTIEDADVSDVSSSNDDGLFYDNTSNFDNTPNDQDVREEEDIGTASDQVHSWKIDHSSGNHKLQRKESFRISVQHM